LTVWLQVVVDEPVLLEEPVECANLVAEEQKTISRRGIGGIESYETYRMRLKKLCGSTAICLRPKPCKSVREEVERGG
jgi:hypothetical protein